MTSLKLCSALALSLATLPLSLISAPWDCTPNKADMFKHFPLLSEKTRIDCPSKGCEHFKRGILKEELLRLKSRHSNDEIMDSVVEGG